jgi:hypothetical protein
VKGELPGRTDGVAREESAEIDELKRVAYVRNIRMEAYRAIFPRRTG